MHHSPDALDILLQKDIQDLMGDMLWRSPVESINHLRGSVGMEAFRTVHTCKKAAFLCLEAIWGILM